MFDFDDFYRSRSLTKIESYNQDGSITLSLTLNSKTYSGTLYPQPSIEDLQKENELLKEKIKDLLGPSLNNS